MAQLSDEQVGIIQDRIYAEVDNIGLQNDLLDHYCCFIEAHMDNGTDFETAYQNAFQAITPNGMHEIQEELFFLFTFKKQINMKRAIYGFGFAAAFLISFGIMFRTMHWHGAFQMFIWGFASLFTTVVLMLLSFLKRMNNQTAIYKLRIFAGLLAGLLIASGNLFKLHSFPTANIQIVLGMCILNVVFLPMLFYQLYKQAIVNN
jgi:hypothetical protein